MDGMTLEDRLNNLLRPLVEGLGYEFVGLELSGPRHALLRIYIDHPRAGGVNLDDCETVSREVAALLDVEDPIESSYRLEVSSPGLDRPLFTLAQYLRYQGERVKVTLHLPVDGRRRVQGVVDGAVDDKLCLIDDEGERVEIPFSSVARGRLLPDYDAILRGDQPKN